MGACCRHYAHGHRPQLSEGLEGEPGPEALSSELVPSPPPPECKAIGDARR